MANNNDLSYKIDLFIRNDIELADDPPGSAGHII
jgi:hypothetical protein